MVDRFGGEPAVTDVIVAGAGGCGLVAALVAATSGARVLLVEKTDKPGGGTALSHLGVRAAGSRYQRKRGVADGPDLYAREILSRNGHQSDPAVTQRLAEVSGRMVDFLAEAAGVDFHLDDFAFGQGAPRSHTWRGDKPITDFLFEAVEKEPNIEVRFTTPVVSLLQESNGAVGGVITDEGAIPGSKVILATGGFGASVELLSRYIPKAADVPFPGHHGSTGDGIKMGLAVGAVAEQMGAFQPYPAHVGPGKRGVPPGVVMAGGVMVDRAGRRFIDETRYPGGVAAAILDLPGKHAYEIFDERIYQMHYHGSRERGLAGLSADGLLKSAETPGHLAAQLDIDGAGLARTILDYHRAVGGDGFGRVVQRPFAPPYYGIKVTVALYHTQGGLKVDHHARVLRGDGTAILNLYAGGGVAVGVSGRGLDGYLPGNGLLASLGLGLVAAEHAVQSLPRST